MPSLSGLSLSGLSPADLGVGEATSAAARQGAYHAPFGGGTRQPHKTV
ncbi:MAG: hypothetical protein MK165_03995 [Pirellulaceae bacterium]|nr:hypothetical protein [Pirellulaceae bacterium]